MQDWGGTISLNYAAALASRIPAAKARAIPAGANGASRFHKKMSEKKASESRGSIPLGETQATTIGKAEVEVCEIRE